MELSNPFNAAAANTPQFQNASFTQLLEPLARDRDVIIIGDSDHTNPDLHEPLRNPETYEAAKRAGVTDVYLEVPQEMQGDMNAMLDGKMSRDAFLEKITDRYVEEFVNLDESDPMFQENKEKVAEYLYKKDPEFTQRMGDYADQAIAAHSAGLNVHAADPQTIHEMAETGKRQIYFQLYMEESENNPDAVDNSGLSDAIEQRFKRDPEIAQDIAETSGGKAMIVYGKMHINQSEDYSLDDALRQRGLSTGTIELTDSDPSEIIETYKYNNETGFRQDTPDHVYNPMTGQSSSAAPSAPSPAMEQKIDYGQRAYAQ